MRNIHYILLRRLVVAWLAISLALGSGVFVYNLYSLDRHLLALASSESDQLAQESMALLQSNGSNQGALHTRLSDFLRRHFIVVRVYDAQGELLAEKVNPLYHPLVSTLEAPLPLGEIMARRSFTRGEDKVVEVMVPLRRATGEKLGYVTGTLLIESNTVHALRQEMMLTLAGVLAVVLITTLTLYPVIVVLNRDLLQTSRDLLKSNLELMAVLGSAVAQRDSETGSHNGRVILYAVALAEAVGQPIAAIRDLIVGALLHDVGKIGIPDNILLKPGPLSDKEFAIMKTHVQRGTAILDKSVWLQRAREVVEFHHEKFDGSGYDRGLVGKSIPLNARIFAVVDVFDALTSRRSYKEALPLDAAMDMLRKGSGHHFDPNLIIAFTSIAPALYARLAEIDDDSLAAQLRPVVAAYFLEHDKPVTTT